jgi:PAS domain S-box-containing protein
MSSAGDPAKVLKLHPAAASGEGEESARVRAGKAGKKKRDEHEIHPVLGRQLMEAADQNGKLQVRKLIEIVSRQYESYESDRNSLATVMQLASDEANAMTEALERESASKLQAILDHVKDGIISCDQYGRIESLNRTAERFFGVRQSDLLSLTLDELLPELAPHGDVARALEDLEPPRRTRTTISPRRTRMPGTAVAS